MSSHIAGNTWRKRAASVDPAAMHFTAVESSESRSCAGRLFETQRMAVCDQAGAIAAAADLPDCSPLTGPTFIYVLDKKTDPRQVRIAKTTISEPS